MRKRIPTLLALLLLIASIGFGIFLITVQKNRADAEKNILKPQNPLSANITDNSATILWHTQIPSIGKVVINNKEVSDDRDKMATPQPRKTHFVTITELTPATTYRVEIKNDQHTFAEVPITFSTISQDLAEKTLTAKGLQPIRGTVLETSQQPAAEALIVLNAKDLSPKATYITTAGNFILPTTKLITADQSNLLQIQNQLPATLEIRNNTAVSLAQIILPIKDHTLPSVTLGKNENFTAFLSQPAPSPIALEFTTKQKNFDLNNDGKINTLDSSLLSDIIAKEEFIESADFNTDQKIDQGDLELIKQNLQ